MRMMKTGISVLLCWGWMVFCGVSAAADRPGGLPPEAFLQLARHRAALQNSFAVLSGTVSHLRRNVGGAETYPIEFMIRFGADRTQARLTLDRREIYDFERESWTLPGAERTQPAASAPADSLLGKLGFQVADLALGFLDYPVRAEEKNETVKTVPCRVLLLNAPDGGTVRVWIASEYLFPLRAAFFAPGDAAAKTPERTLEITGFKKIDNYYVATDVALLSRSYRTRIAFQQCEVGRADDPRAAAAFAAPVTAAGTQPGD